MMDAAERIHANMMQRLARRHPGVYMLERDVGPADFRVTVGRLKGGKVHMWPFGEDNSLCGVGLAGRAGLPWFSDVSAVTCKRCWALIRVHD